MIEEQLIFEIGALDWKINFNDIRHIFKKLIIMMVLFMSISN